MTPERWQQIEGVFLRAIEVPPGERAKFLDEACNGDEALRREVNSLLENDSPSVPLVRTPLPSIADGSEDLAGRQIGVYRLVRLLGHGGMGSVYLAKRDDDQFQKEVAIKLLKRGMDTEYMLSRFRQERQILANLEHPFIARLLDGGATEDGLPFFVMEYVDGLPITKYCAEKRLNITERLRLFRLVCEALQHAHQNLVIHRDLKPGNILITREGIPKLLDFGIAKLMDPNSGDRTATFTRTELRLMTPAYASPEQARGLTINTATDVYSMGVILYELLSGQRPHRFTTETPAEMEQVISEVEPEKPSVASGNRKLAGDLDNIVLTAMRKEPQRRYASVAEFSEDIGRYMDGLPVAAHEDRWTYRAGKFIMRNRLAVATAFAVLASLVGGIVATTIQAHRAERRFELVRGLANSMLYDFQDQLERLPGSTTVRAGMVQTVVGYLDSLARGTGSDPELDFEIADAYRRVAGLEGHPFRQNLGQTAAAMEHYRQAIAIYSRLAGRPEMRKRATAALIGAQLEIGDIEVRTGKADAAMQRLKDAQATAEAASAADKEAVDPDTWVILYFRLGDAELRRGAAESALPQLRNALEVSRKWAAGDNSLRAHNTLREALMRVGTAQMASGDLVGARDSLRSALAATEELLRRFDATVDLRHALIQAHAVLGDVLGGPDELNLGDRDDALQHYRTALAEAETLAPADPNEVRSRDDLSSMYRRLGAMYLEDFPSEALVYYRKAFALALTLSEANFASLTSRRDLAAVRLSMAEALQRLGKRDDAFDHMSRALEAMQQIVAASPRQVFWNETLVRAHTDVAGILLDRGESEAAIENLTAALKASEKLVEAAPTSLHFQRDRADAFEALGRCYFVLAGRATAGRRAELRAQSRSWYQKGQAVWQGWLKRKVATAYAARREGRVAYFVKNLETQ